MEIIIAINRRKKLETNDFIAIDSEWLRSERERERKGDTL